MVLDRDSAPRQGRGMAIEAHDARAVEALRRAGRAAAATLAWVGAKIRPGISTKTIDRWVRDHTRSLGATPSQLGYRGSGDEGAGQATRSPKHNQGFPAAVCTSRNQVVCHGIPSEREVLLPGDIVNVDVTSCLGGYHGDTSATFIVGDARPEARHVVEVARRCRDIGVSAVRDGARLGDIGAQIEAFARQEGCSIVREFGGHGIGRKMHMDPHVPYVGVPGTGIRLRAGMAITIEPMVNLGGPEVRILEDGWTVVTADGQLSAQFEHTVLVTKTGAEILTQ